FRIPSRLQQQVSVRAHVATDPRHPLDASASLSVQRPTSPPLLVAMAPERVVVAPGDRVPVDVVVRTAEGVPVQGARVLPAGMVLAGHEDEAPRFLTDARGRVHFDWTAPTGGAAIWDTAVTADVVREGVGRIGVSTPIRIASVRWAAVVAAEDGIFP